MRGWQDPLRGMSTGVQRLGALGGESAWQREREKRWGPSGQGWAPRDPDRETSALSRRDGDWVTTVSSGNLQRMNVGVPAGFVIRGHCRASRHRRPFSSWSGFPGASGNPKPPYHLCTENACSEVEADFRLGPAVCSAAAGKRGRCQLSPHHLGGPGSFLRGSGLTAQPAC